MEAYPDFVMHLVSGFLSASQMVALMSVSHGWRRAMCWELWRRGRACVEVPPEVRELPWSEASVDVRNSSWQHELLLAITKVAVGDECLRVDVDAATAAVRSHLEAVESQRAWDRTAAKAMRAHQLVQRTRVLSLEESIDLGLTDAMDHWSQRIELASRETQKFGEARVRASAHIETFTRPLLQGIAACQSLLEGAAPGSGGAQITEEELTANRKLREDLERASSGARVGVQQSLVSVVKDLSNPYRNPRLIKHSIQRVVALTRLFCAMHLRAYPCGVRADGDPALWEQFDELRRLYPYNTLLRSGAHFATRPCFTIHVCDEEHHVLEWRIRVFRTPLVLTRPAPGVARELRMAVLDVCSFESEEPGFLACLEVPGLVHEGDWRQGSPSFTQRSTRRVMQKLAL